MPITSRDVSAESAKESLADEGICLRMSLYFKCTSRASMAAQRLAIARVAVDHPRRTSERSNQPDKRSLEKGFRTMTTTLPSKSPARLTLAGIFLMLVLALPTVGDSASAATPASAAPSTGVKIGTVISDVIKTAFPEVQTVVNALFG